MLDLLSGESANWRKILTPLRFYADGWLVAPVRSSKSLGTSYGARPEARAVHLSSTEFETLYTVGTDHRRSLVHTKLV